MERLLYWLLGKQGNGRHSINPSRFQMRYMFYDWLVIGNAYCVYLMFPFELWTHVKLCFHWFCWPSVSHCQPEDPTGLQRGSFVAFSLPWRVYISSIDEVAENFFPPLSHGWCRKEIAPHICLRRYSFWNCVISTSPSISLGQHEPFEAERQEAELGTEPEPNSSHQDQLSPLSPSKGESSRLGFGCQAFPVKRSKSCF